MIKITKIKSRISKECDTIVKEQKELNENRPFKELVLFGNAKLPDSTAIFNLGSATNCPSAKLGLCKVRSICYAWKEEKRWKNCYNHREESAIYWSNHTSSEFVDDLLLTIVKEQRTITALRFNEAGDLRDMIDLMKVHEIAKKLKKYNIKVYIYTAREDLYNMYKMKNDNLCINGSGFMADNNFTTVDINNIIYNKTTKLCNGNCRLCSLCLEKNKYVIQVIQH